MQFGLINNGGQWEIPQNILNMLNCHVYREFSVDWMFYYCIEIYNLEEINNLVDFFNGVSIEQDPTTTNMYILGIKCDYKPSEIKEDEVPF